MCALDQRLQNVAGKDQTLAYRLRVTVANVVVGQMLPLGVVKGGTAMKIRFGEMAVEQITVTKSSANTLLRSVDDEPSRAMTRTR